MDHILGKKRRVGFLPDGLAGHSVSFRNWAPCRNIALLGCILLGSLADPAHSQPTESSPPLLPAGEALEALGPHLDGVSRRDAIAAIEWSPVDSSFAVGTRGGRVSLWDSTRGREERLLASDLEPVTSLSFGPDGQMLAVVANETPAD